MTLQNIYIQVLLIRRKELRHRGYLPAGRRGVVLCLRWSNIILILFI